MAEQVLPYARSLARALAISAHFLEVIELDELEMMTDPSKELYLDSLLSDATMRQNLSENHR